MGKYVAVVAALDQIQEKGLTLDTRQTRQALALYYRAGAYAQCERLLRRLLQLEPDNPDGYGELGNMFFSQGLWELAASAYFEAGTRLVKEGQLEQARQLVDVIRGLDGTQADELNKLITAAQAATH